MSHTIKYLCETFRAPVDHDDPAFEKVIAAMFDGYIGLYVNPYMNEATLTRVAQDLGDPAAEDRAYVIQMLREMDVDRSGLIDVDEFRRGMAVCVNRGHVITPTHTPYTNEDITTDPPPSLTYLRETFGNKVDHREPKFSRACKKMFTYWCGDYTAFMNEAQMGAAARDLGDCMATDDAAVKKMFREMDTDASGSLDSGRRWQFISTGGTVGVTYRVHKL